MISPHTPPGTRLVVVWADPMPQGLICIAPAYRDTARSLWLLGALDEHKFNIGEHYVLRLIEPNEAAATGFVARVHGLDGAWALECFEVAALPKCLTELQVDDKVPEDA